MPSIPAFRLRVPARLRGAALTAALSMALAAALVATLLAASLPSFAADSDDALYQALGSRPGVAALTDDFVDRLLADRRMNPFFKDAELPKLREQLADQFCAVSGGPCRYGGKDMKKAHEGVDITKADFNALVEVLQQAMEARGIAFATQNRLLARLAPMHREVVNAP